ncbi:glycosyltransferase family 2 protein [Allohahella sp. A8]|uniref:glycosyltransferase family 2 protein n=1 Tax=Allohahella sp. A8 TaxID=3141461 RepID=UPI0026961CE6|tara:strand:- start:4396 stop:5445 length:1050 start_codon:yes stop_codon:yes gene_type:complete
MAIELSVVVPLYNEEDNVRLMFERIDEALQPFKGRYEIIFVDDGSRDRTFQVASEIAATTPYLRVITFRRNYGQTPAMAAGIDNAVGELIVTMDGDLQNDPSDIPFMVEKLRAGDGEGNRYDIVVGWRHNRQDKLVTRKIPSMIANRLIGKVTGVPIKDNGCSLKVYRAEVMQKMPFYNEMHRFIPALLSLGGARVAEVKVKHHARQFGESKYGLSRIYKVLFDLLTMKTILSLITHPVRWFLRLALIPLLLTLVSLAFVVSGFTAGEPIVVSATHAVLFLNLTLFLVSLGFISELIYNKSPLDLGEVAPLTARLDLYSGKTEVDETARSAELRTEPNNSRADHRSASI